MPQGSNLGPELFDIYTDDIVGNLSVKHLLYADDLKLFCRVDDRADCQLLQANLDMVDEWCRANFLSLNASKCYVQSYTRKRSPTLYDYSLDAYTLSRPGSVRDLGVCFDPALSFRMHINDVVRSAYRSLGFVIRNSRDFTDIATIRLLYCTFVRSKLEYACIIWSPLYKVHIKSLESVQRRFLKFLSFRLDGVYPPRGFPDRELQSRFHLQSLNNRRAAHSVVYLHKILFGEVDCAEILSGINFRVPVAHLRSKALFLLPFARTNLMASSPLSRMYSNHGLIEDDVDILFCTPASIHTAFSRLDL